MKLSEFQIEQIVKTVISNVKDEAKVKTDSLGVYDCIHVAIKEAKKAQAKIKKLSFEERERIIENIRKKVIENAKTLAELGVEETKMGRVDHKILKHQLLANKTPGTEGIQTVAWSGKGGLTLVEMGPFGVIGAITPSTNPSETVICNTIGMLAAGNSVVFNPHPNGKKVSNLAVTLVNEASIEVGGPANIATSVSNPTLESGDVLMKHKDISLLVVTGGPGVVTSALSSGKRAIGAGAGNPPVIVDETADLKKAAKDIIDGATFDNNLPCIAEKEVVALSAIVDELIANMIKNGAHLINEHQLEKLQNLVLLNKDGKHYLNREWVGKDAYKIAKAIGIENSDNIRCLIFKGSKDHIMIKEELMMPILGIVTVQNIDEAIEAAKELEQGNRHSAHMHSKNIDNLTKFAREIDTAIFVKNAPSYAALGMGGEGFCSFTIASRTGEGISSPKTFTKERRCVLSDGLSIR